MAFEKTAVAQRSHILSSKSDIRCHKVPYKEAGNLYLMQQEAPATTEKLNILLGT